MHLAFVLGGGPALDRAGCHQQRGRSASRYHGRPEPLCRIDKLPELHAWLTDNCLCFIPRELKLLPPDIGIKAGSTPFRSGQSSVGGFVNHSGHCEGEPLRSPCGPTHDMHFAHKSLRCR